MRIGVDVGGTNTDAVVMNGREVVAWVKTPTTRDVGLGVAKAISEVLAAAKAAPSTIEAVMIGTTHFTNAVVERRNLLRVAAVRLGLPATTAVPPFSGWPADLVAVVGGEAHLVAGGHEFDGRVISPLDEGELLRIGRQIRDRGIAAAAVTSVFALVNPEMEIRAAELLTIDNPGLKISLSHQIGTVGLLQRENSTIINAALSELAVGVVGAFRRALAELRIEAPFFISQNDGTLMKADWVERYPVLTFASGPTNSIRGAAFLAGIGDAMVVDIGGTTTDIGMLRNGFPRQSTTTVDIGGVRTNFRMPDVLSIGLGGGSHVRDGGDAIGPDSVGYELITRARVFGGPDLTTTDVMVAAGSADVGDAARVANLDPAVVERARARIRMLLDDAIDRMKTEPGRIPVIVVGGGAILMDWDLPSASELLIPDFASVANAIGAAIAQVAGDVDRIVSMEGRAREDVLGEAKSEAIAKAVDAGAVPESVFIVEIEEIPINYLPGNASRLKVKAVGDLPTTRQSAAAE